MGRRANIIGVGMVKFAKPGASEEYDVMASKAAHAAIKDAGIAFGDIQQAYAGYVFGDSTCGQRAVYSVGLTGIPVINVNNNCSTGSTALYLARQAVEGIIARGQQPPSGHIPFTPRSKKVLELSLREALQLGTDYIGTEHILLALLREGDGVAAQVLVASGLDLNRVRQQVIGLEHGGEEAGVLMSAAPAAEDDLTRRLTSIAARLDAIEQRLRQSAAD